MQRISEWFANKKQTAVFFGIAVQSLDKWIARGCPYERNGRALKFYLPEVVVWRTEWKTAETGSLEHERTRLAKEQADKTELENKVSRGKLITVHEPVAMLEKILIAFRSRILSIPTKAAPLVHGCATLSETRDKIENSLHDALNELAQLDVTAIGSASGDRSGPTTTEADGKRMGRSRKKTKSGVKRGAGTVANK